MSEANPALSPTDIVTLGDEQRAVEIVTQSVARGESPAR